MGIFKFSMGMLKKEYKQSIVYTLTLCLSIAVCFLFFNIIDNPYLIEHMEEEIIYLKVPFSSIISFVIIIFCAFMIIFANNFYISKKTKEIAIMTMSGSSYLDITLYLFYQNIVMTVIAFPLGILIGCLASMCVNQMIYQYLSYQISFFYLPMDIFSHTLFSVMFIILAQLLYASGFVYRKDISYMLSQNNKSSSDDIRIISFSPILYIFIYVLGILILITSIYSLDSVIVASAIGMFGINGMIKYYLESFLLKIKKCKYLKDSLKLISLSYLYYSLRKSVLLVVLYGVCTSMMVGVIIFQQNNVRNMMTAIIAYVVIIVLLLSSIIYKYLMEAYGRKMMYFNLYKLGYSYHQLVCIIRQEIMFFYEFVIGMPFIFIIIILVRAYTIQEVTVLFIFIIIGSQILSGLFACILTYHSYKKIVLRFFKEDVNI